MEIQENGIDPWELPFRIEDDLGEITWAEEEAPGVYYLAVRGMDSQWGAECYVVTPDTPVISDEARSYGQELPHHPGLRLYPLEERVGADIVRYEFCKYRAAKGLPLQEYHSLYELVTFAREDNPSYFGAYPAPVDTPWGRTLRYWTIDNGIYWLETERLKTGLAVCYPVWRAELLLPTRKGLGVQTARDREQGAENACGYLFFREADSCVALFEISLLRDKGWKGFEAVDLPALINAVCETHPQYADWYNKEVAGDIKIARMPDAGVNFLKF